MTGRVGAKGVLLRLESSSDGGSGISVSATSTGALFAGGSAGAFREGHSEFMVTARSRMCV